MQLELQDRHHKDLLQTLNLQMISKASYKHRMNF
jgi:hypothetical protein